MFYLRGKSLPKASLGVISKVCECLTRRENYSFCHPSLEREAVGQRRNRKMYEREGERKEINLGPPERQGHSCMSPVVILV